MTVTEIKPRRKGIVAVIADGEEYLLNSETVAAAGIKEKSVLTEAEMKKLCLLSECDRAKSRALWYLSRADHSRRALHTKLCRNFSCEAAEYATSRMEELGLVDDMRYARRLAENLCAANISQKEIERKLFVKGVPRDIIREVVADLSPDTAGQIAELLRTKYKNRLSSEDGVKKVYAALIRKGFSWSDVKAALKNYSENLENCEEY